jgi:hypothetical protein
VPFSREKRREGCMNRSLRIAYRAATPLAAHQFETQARLRARVLVMACFATQEECADYLRLPLRTVSRWLNRGHHLPAWVLLALEQRARELGVVVAVERKAA